MLNAFFLVLTTFGLALQNILKKHYNEKTNNKGTLLFASLSVFSACLFFLVSSGFKLNFTLKIVPYALSFAFSYGLAVLLSLLSIKFGPLSLTSLVSSYSLIIPTLYGLFFLDEKVSAFFYVGLAILCISLFLMNSKKSETRITLLWVVLVFLAFLGNGICSTVQMVQQKTFDGKYKSEFMIMALFIVTLITLASVLVSERKDMGACLKSGSVSALLCGLVNGGCNLLVMFLAVSMKASIMYPILSAGGIIITAAVSRFVYKEHLSSKQYAALALGTLSVVLMNI